MALRPGLSRNTSAMIIGAVVWIIGTAQFFVAHLITQSAWNTPYSWAQNNISDLGNVRCGTWGDNARYVCSPLHVLMNTSFVLQGTLLIVGLILTASFWRGGCASRGAYTLLILAAVGWIIAGLIPADVNENLHVVLGVPPIFICGNLGLVVIGAVSPARQTFVEGAYTVLSGCVGLVGTGLFLSQHFLGLGMGGMKRVAAFPLIIWSFVTGTMLLVNYARGGVTRQYASPL